MLPLSDILGLKKWVEVGNSGVFRPEMLLPMGLPENVSVIAWGLSLERLLVCHGRTDCRKSQCNCWNALALISDFLLSCQLVRNL